MILHISHNDLDGVGCGILVKKAFGTNISTMYVTHSDTEDALKGDMSKYATVIITDLSLPAAHIEAIAGERELIFIDHHKSSEALAKHSFATHSIKECATLLTYHKLTEMGYDVSAYEDFAYCVNDFDLWLLKRDDSLRMNMLFSIYGLSRFEKRFLNEPYAGFTGAEVMLMSFEDERRRNYIHNAVKNIARHTDKQGRNFAVVFAESFTSELGNYVLENNSEFDYVVIINAQRQRLSIRSKKDVDVSVIAVNNGGGGHKNAAGFLLNSNFSANEILKTAGII
ncbi:hypothetical protein RsTz2092_11140 [Deferribacterales bacterium RsTz2092]|nr:hypothetical protein AGMMS49941_09280 [Deferribacterales bacterium]